VTGWYGEQWDSQNNEKTMEHSDHWIVTGWYGEQWDSQSNEKTMEHSDHWDLITMVMFNDEMPYLSCKVIDRKSPDSDVISRVT
jgi:hypothetical protein